MHRGDVDKLKPEWRLALARDGYALVKCEHAVFKPEIAPPSKQPAPYRRAPTQRRVLPCHSF